MPVYAQEPISSLEAVSAATVTWLSRLSKGRACPDLASIVFIAARTQGICAGRLPVVGIRLHRLAVGCPLLAPAQRSAWVSAFVRLGAVQQRVFVLLLVAAVLGAPVFVVGVAVACFDFGGPGVVFCGLAADVVRVRLFGFVREDTLAEELVEVVSRDSSGDGEEDAALRC
jgi:hypothetical protein